MDADPTFSPAEKDEIAKIWQRAAEDFSPFDVDVTTQTPPVGGTDRHSDGNWQPHTDDHRH